MRTSILALLLPACGWFSNPPAAPPAEPPKPAPVMRESHGTEQDLADTLAFFATRPQEETALVPGLGPVEGVGGRSAEVCGSCHQAIYEEWQVSTHRHAWNDPQFQKEITKSGNTWLCRNCHTPTLLQQPVWPVGLVDGDVEAPILVDNPGYDPELMDQGITCVACHVRDGQIHGPGLPDSTAPHPVQTDPQYRSAALCERCHQAEQTYPGKGFVCTFTTGKEWRASPQHEDGETCVTCHMPAVERPVAVGGPVREVRRHWFKGSGIPKFAGQAPPDDAPPGPGLALEPVVGEGILTLKVRNEGAGHMLPSGDVERWVQLDVRFVDGAGDAVGEPWQHRFGQVWEWWPEPRRKSDNRLAPKEERALEVVIPQGAQVAVVEASNHRMSAETASYHELGDYPRSVRTHRLEVPLSGP